MFGQTDKSGKYTVNSHDSYIAQGDVHVKDDIKIGWLEVNQIQHEVKCHMKALNNVFKVSEGHGDQESERTRRTNLEQATIIPQMIVNQKKDEHCVML